MYNGDRAKGDKPSGCQTGTVGNARGVFRCVGGGRALDGRLVRRLRATAFLFAAEPPRRAAPQGGVELGSPVAFLPQTTAVFWGLLFTTVFSCVKRIKQFQLEQSVFGKILQQLVPNVVSNYFFISPYGIYKVTTIPK